MRTDRRRLLRGAALLPLAGASWQLWATPATPPARLLVVFLRGAYDAPSVLVPHGEPFYYEARPHIALARPNEQDPNASMQLQGRWGLHPALADTMLPLWQAGELAFVPFAGTDFVSRSHFEAQDRVELGDTGSARTGNASSGFLNRLLAQLGATPADRQVPAGIAFTQSLPLSLRGAVQVANTPVGAAPRQAADMAQEQLIQALYRGHPLQPLVEEGLGLRERLAQELREEMQASSRGAPTAGGFALEAGRVGRLLREQPRYAVGFMDVGGWDTHAQQGGAQGALAARLRGLGEGLQALAAGLGEAQWRRTVVVVLSEFGRTFRENGTRGTDHGHGSTLWILGGAVRAGVRGEQAGLRPQDLHQERDLPVLNEYRATLAGLLGRLYGLGPGALAQVFPQVRAVDLGLL